MAQTEREMEDMNKSWEDRVAESGQTSSVSILWLFHIRLLATLPLRKYEILGSADLYPEQKSRRCTRDFVLLYLHHTVTEPDEAILSHTPVKALQAH